MFQTKAQGKPSENYLKEMEISNLPTKIQRNSHKNSYQSQKMNTVRTSTKRKYKIIKTKVSSELKNTL